MIVEIFHTIQGVVDTRMIYDEFNVSLKTRTTYFNNIYFTVSMMAIFYAYHKAPSKTIGSVSNGLEVLNK